MTAGAHTNAARFSLTPRYSTHTASFEASEFVWFPDASLSAQLLYSLRFNSTPNSKPRHCLNRCLLTLPQLFTYPSLSLDALYTPAQQNAHSSLYPSAQSTSRSSHGRRYRQLIINTFMFQALTLSLGSSHQSHSTPLHPPHHPFPTNSITTTAQKRTLTFS